jgi:deazaflavin-dependent oxidoreductase (nitroreductase family)
LPFDRLSFPGDCRVGLEPRTSWVSGCALSATAGRVLVVGSAGGGPKHPDWYHNLVANPQVTVETGIFTYEAVALVLRDAERDEIFARLVEADPGWGEYQSKATRTIPVVALTPATSGPPTAGSFAGTLQQIRKAELFPVL